MRDRYFRATSEDTIAADCEERSIPISPDGPLATAGRFPSLAESGADHLRHVDKTGCRVLVAGCRR
jgi:hypothetical protein